MKKLTIFCCLVLFLFVPLMVFADNSNQTKIYVTVKPNNTIIVQQNNTEIEKLIRNMMEKPDEQWHQGDIIITSGTIFAFFGFGSFLVLRFDSTKWEEQLKWMVVLLIFIGAVQTLHLSVIISIMLGGFKNYIYIIILGTTIGFLFVILFAVYKIAYYENKYSSKKSDTVKEVDDFKKRIASEQRDVFDTVERKLDDLRRERFRFERESGS
ncbi:MAG: hypothetical protein ACYC6W_09305 [Nitrosotalea sp.]